jgi:GNAT superfamily N-acetyltransferase
MEINKLTHNDAKRVADSLYKEWSNFYNTYTLNKTPELLLKNYVLKNINNIYIGLKDTNFVGCFTLINDYIYDVYVEPEYRNKKYGTQLIEYIINNTTYNNLYLYREVDDLNIEKFYNKFGFKDDNHKDKLKRPRMKLCLKKNNNNNYLIIIIILLIIFIFLLY